MTDEPRTVDRGRVLGVVPGRPPVGERRTPEDDDLVMVWPHLLVRHAVAALVALVLVLVISLFFDAPLKEIANPNLTPNPEKAPWYFVGLQELLSHLHPAVAGVLVPTTVIVGLAILPYLDRNPAKKPGRRSVAVWTFTIFLFIWVGLTVIGFAFRGPDWGFVLPWRDGWYGEL